MARVFLQEKNLGGKNQTRYCDECSAPTRERKPLCSEHILNGGYAKELFEMVEAADNEILRAAKVGKSAIDINGLIVREILKTLINIEKITWRRLLKDHVSFLNDATTKTTGHYLRVIKDAGFVEVGMNGRNVAVVSLTELGLRHARGETDE